MLNRPTKSFRHFFHDGLQYRCDIRRNLWKHHTRPNGRATWVPVRRLSESLRQALLEARK